jgi:cell division protein FtsB
MNSSGIKDWLKNKYVLFALIAASFFSILIFNGNLRATLARRKAIRETQKELDRVEQDIEQMKFQLASLESKPHTQEDLVRRELGYLKPGEKEIRFIQPNTKKK